MLFAYSFAALACAYALQGAFRALDSGPLEAWFVDRILAADPEVRLDSALSGGSAMLSVGIAAGALTAAGLAALPVTGIEPLALPVLVAVLVAAALTRARADAHRGNRRRAPAGHRCASSRSVPPPRPPPTCRRRRSTQPSAEPAARGSRHPSPRVQPDMCWGDFTRCVAAQ